MDRSIARQCIGVIADTHGLFDPSIVEHFAGVTAILHAGDIGDSDVIRQLQQIAPVFAVSGNVDDFEQSGYPRVRVIRRAGVTIAIRHILHGRGQLTDEARQWLDSTQPHICVFGHSHRPAIEQYGGTILFNPGSAGPRRFSLPRGVGVLTIAEGRITPQLIRLEDSVGSGTTKDRTSRSKKGAST
ncbi:MAG: metallophosphoesterase family protein [Nitrospira sp. CG24D]|nr:MAG: metallophosphoesterase family protein [Nitrospira sp. CG24D]